MKNLNAVSLILLTFLPLTSFGEKTAEQNAAEKSAKKAFFEQDKIDLSASNDVLWSIINDARFIDTKGKYSGTPQCNEDGEMILDLGSFKGSDSNKKKEFTQNIKNCNAAQYGGTVYITKKSNLLDQCKTDQNDCKKFFHLHLLGALYRKTGFYDIPIKDCIEKYFSNNEISEECKKFFIDSKPQDATGKIDLIALINARRTQVDLEISKASSKTKAVTATILDSVSAFNLFSQKSEQSSKGKLASTKDSLTKELSIIDFISNFHFSQSFKASDECEKLAEETIKLIDVVQDPNNRPELYKRAFIHANSDNKADGKKARKIGKKWHGVGEKYPEDLFEKTVFTVTSCPTSLPTGVTCKTENQVLQLSLPSAITDKGKRNACVNGMKPKNRIKGLNPFAKKTGNFSVTDLHHFGSDDTEVHSPMHQ